MAQYYSIVYTPHLPYPVTHWRALGVSPGRLQGRREYTSPTSGDNAKLFSGMVVLIRTPAGVFERSRCSTSSPTLGSTSFQNFPNWYVWNCNSWWFKCSFPWLRTSHFYLKYISVIAACQNEKLPLSPQFYREITNTRHCVSFFKYILLIMLLQLSHFLSPYSPPPCTPPPTRIPPLWFMSMGHTYKFFGFYISYTVLTLPLSIFHLPFMLLILCTFSPSHSPVDNPPCDLHFCGSVPVLVVCLVCFCFCFRCGC